MRMHKNISLRPFNTFGIEARAAFFCFVDDAQQIDKVHAFIHQNNIPLLILGQGSNILFTRDFDGLVAYVNFSGIALIGDDAQNVWLDVKAGTSWETLIDYCIENHYCGLENLTWIPGKVGSAPIQNIGAYGVELKDVLHSVAAYDFQTGQNLPFSNEDCHFSYRNSIFKHFKGRYFITQVTFKLSKNFQPVLNYEGLRKYLETRNIKPTLENIRNAVRDIRKQKLPEVGVTGSAGSFFKNPVVSVDLFTELKEAYGEFPNYPSPDGYKVPAAWLIEQCGFKGIRRGDAGVWPGQPLILVNYGNATGKEILELAMEIMEAVQNRFKIKLEPEVNII